MCISHWISLSNKLTPFFSLCVVEFSSRKSLAQQLQYRMARRKQNTIPPCPWHLMYRAGPSASYAGFFKRQKNKNKNKNKKTYIQVFASFTSETEFIKTPTCNCNLPHARANTSVFWPDRNWNTHKRLICCTPDCFVMPRRCQHDWTFRC